MCRLLKSSLHFSNSFDTIIFVTKLIDSHFKTLRSLFSENIIVKVGHLKHWYRMLLEKEHEREFVGWRERVCVFYHNNNKRHHLRLVGDSKILKLSTYTSSQRFRAPSTGVLIWCAHSEGDDREENNRIGGGGNDKHLLRWEIVCKRLVNRWNCKITLILLKDASRSPNYFLPLFSLLLIYSRHI